MKYSYQNNDRTRFSLHDCRAKHIEREGNLLTFFFPDGIYYEEYGDDWPNTGKAAVSFTVDDLRGVTFYLFAETDGQTVRRQIELEQLIEKVNQGIWELEFAYRYDGYQEIMYSCWLWQQEIPYMREAQLFIGFTEEPVFLWDPDTASETSGRLS